MLCQCSFAYTLLLLLPLSTQVSYTQVQLMVPLFSRINSCQVANMAKLLRNLSPQQMLGSLGMLDGFQFQLGPIGIRVSNMCSILCFMICHSKKCGWLRTSSSYRKREVEHNNM